MNTDERDARQADEDAGSQAKPERDPRQERHGGAQDHAGEPGSTDHVQQTLDEALADSFPASDPVSIVTSQHEEAWEHRRRSKE
jgi:hypothetical protein